MARTTKILLTGIPGIGKTTLIQKILQGLTQPARGFYTQEVREHGIRVGFSLNLLSGPTLTLSHVSFKGPNRVGKYGVDVKTFENAACSEIEAGLAAHALIVIDEIGKMELFSEKFRCAVLEALQSNVQILGTVLQQGHPFADSLKSKPDLNVIEVTKENRDQLVPDLIARLSA